MVSEKQNLDKQIERNENSPLVSISCIAFNQYNYIRECLDGLLMQQTNFEYEILIHDDASTDGTAEIIKEYWILHPKIIKPIFQRVNQYSKGVYISATYNFPRAKGKYIAMCEGDDYWIDSLKLQKQVDYMENNLDCDLVYTQVKQYKQSDERFLRDPFGGPFERFSDLIKQNTIPSLTVLLKKDILDNYLNEVEPEKQKWLLGDYPLWLYVALFGKIHYVPEKTGVYRIRIESLSHSKDFKKIKNLIESDFAMRHYFIGLNGNSDESLDIEEFKKYSLFRHSLMYKNINSFKYFKALKNKRLYDRFSLLLKKILIGYNYFSPHRKL